MDVLHFVTMFLDYLPQIWEASFSRPIITTVLVEHAYRHTIRFMDGHDIFGSGVDADSVDDFMLIHGDGQDDSSYDVDGDVELSDGDSFIYDVDTEDGSSTESEDSEDDNNAENGGVDNSGDDNNAESGDADVCGDEDDGDVGDNNAESGDVDGSGDEDDGDVGSDGNGGGDEDSLANFMPPVLINIPQHFFDDALLDQHAVDICHIIRQDDMVYYQTEFVLLPDAVYEIKRKIVEYMKWAVDYYRIQAGLL